MGALILALCVVGAPRFVIEPPSCAPAWFSAVALEDMLRADTSSTTRAYVAVLLPDCAALDVVEVTVMRAGVAPVQVPLSLAGVPEGLRLRTVGLAVAELLVDTRIAPPPRQPWTPPPPPPVEVVVRDGVRRSLAAGPRLRVGLARGDWTAGASVEVEAEWHMLSAQLGVAALLGVSEAAYLGWVGGSLAVSWRLVEAPVALDLGPWLELGVGSVAGRGTRGLSHAAALVLAGGRARARWAIGGDGWSLTSILGLGGYVVGLDGRDEGGVVVGLSGAAVELSAALQRTW